MAQRLSPFRYLLSEVGSFQALSPFGQVLNESEAGIVFELAGDLAVAAIGHVVLTGDPGSFTRYWRVPSTAAQGTTRQMIVFAAGTTANTISYQGTVVADANGNFDLVTSDLSALGTKRFVMISGWDGSTDTVSIRGGPAIAEIIQVN